MSISGRYIFRSTTAFLLVGFVALMTIVHVRRGINFALLDPPEDYLRRVAKALEVQQRRIDEICTGKRGITAGTAVRLGLAFGVEPQF